MGSTVKGFIKYFSAESFKIGLRMKKDIEFYHKAGCFCHYFVMPRVKCVGRLIVNLSSIIRMSHRSLISKYSLHLCVKV